MPSESEYQRHWDELLEETRERLKNRGRIPVTNEIHIEFDRDDTWFSLNDVDYSSYDGMSGYVILPLDAVDPLIDALAQLRSLKYYAGKHRAYPVKQWKGWECRLMNLLDFRYWFCDCHYWPPYGKVISGDCRRHD